MFRLRLLTRTALRLLQHRSASTDPLLHQLKGCRTEEEIFDIVGKNKAKLSVSHIDCAVSMLWTFQKEKAELLRTVELIKRHSQFLALRILAENKIVFMDDDAVVNMLYNMMRLNVEPCDSLIQELVVEAWRRLEGFDLSTLSKFAVCLNDQNLYQSPLMGNIADIVSRRLDLVEDTRVLSNLMISISALTSAHLRDRLIQKAEFLLETMASVRYNDARRVVQFLRNVRFGFRPLLEKCNKIFLQSINKMDAETFSIILGLYQSLQFNNCEFRLAAKQRLIDIMDTCTDPNSFTRLFAALGPMASQDTKERLEAAALLKLEELSYQQLLAVLETMEEMECRNPQLIRKSAAFLQKHLDIFRPVEVARMTQTLLMLHYRNPEFYTKIKVLLTSFLQISVTPCEIAMLVRVLSMLPASRVDNDVISRIDAVLPQCNLSDLNTFALATAKWIRNDPSHHHSTSGVYVKLLQKLNKFGIERLRKANNMDLLLEETKYISGEWFEEMLLEEAIITCQRLLDQLTWTNIIEFALFLTRTNYLCMPILDRLADVTLKHISKIHYSAIYAVLLPFIVLNYDSPQSDELLESCIQHITPHLSSFDPHLLVLLGYSLAVAEYVPEELIKEVFNVDFLAKLDAQLETFPDALNMRIRLRLMELNRAICLECPEFQVPWFHDRYCQQMRRKGIANLSGVQQQVHKMLGEILGGIHYAKVSAITPYYYVIDFECILDKNNKPIPYVDQNTVLITELQNVKWGEDSQLIGRKGLPPGAQRTAIEFLDSKSFCRNLHHPKGEAVMKKRHLEILGYRVIQIPHFEWNSMELSTKDAWMEYLRKKIFVESSDSST
ncbi:FAST kinase domain-containing protein 1, mitochondrial [Protopterus annectens]|uniref:FAST kinase domain-containing protein 1, mitochondrial n=1 Tax=Protopterus annectens TaxID=7888 RepID=UPI001CFB3B69|nr:FAST kinase domain-containing protein 1, mitochondrial [Protopterus annectens]